MQACVISPRTITSVKPAECSVAAVGKYLESDGCTSASINIGSDANIVVNGEAAELADIEVGMVLVAEGTENSDGSLDATRVRAGDMGLRGDGFGGRGFHGPGFGPGLGGDEQPDATAAPDATDGAS